MEIMDTNEVKVWQAMSAVTRAEVDGPMESRDLFGYSCQGPL